MQDTDPTQATVEAYDVPLERMFTYRLARLHALLNAQAIRILKVRAGVSLAEWRVLAALATRGEVPAAEIIRLTDVDKSQLSRNIKKMVERGLITSHLDASNQRTLAKTDRGRALFQELSPLMRQRQDFLMKCLTGDEQDALFKAFDRLEERARRLEEQI
ncbi:MAG: winged helix-turn-helix transcriptional regulator [Pelagimonas sp.]